jgi:hypothetical protein
MCVSVLSSVCVVSVVSVSVLYSCMCVSCIFCELLRC